jgi:hypothetical protein
MKLSKFLSGLLIFLLGFLSLSAIVGGILLILSPQGSGIEMPIKLLDNSPFKNFLIPGIILLVIFGLIPIYIIYALKKKPENRFMQKLNLLHDHHFAWTFAVYTGFGQIIWINVQTLIMNSVVIIHTFYSSLGILIVCIALLPEIRRKYKL